MEIRYKSIFENKEKAIKPFNLRIQTFLDKIKINSKIIYYTILPKTTLWTINQPITKLDLTKLSKTKTHPITFQVKFFNIQKNFPNHHHIYTDGSKQGMKVGCAAIFQNQELLKCLPNESSIYNEEATAIDLAMDIITNHKSSKFIIHSDSKSVLTVKRWPNKQIEGPLQKVSDRHVCNNLSGSCKWFCGCGLLFWVLLQRELVWISSSGELLLDMSGSVGKPPILEWLLA